MADDELGSFPRSEWSQVEQARAGSSSRRQAALANLITGYLPPLRAYLLLRMRLNRTRTEDYLHDFIQDKILEHDLISSADPAKGRMRSLLLRSLHNYVIDRLRKEARRQGPSIDVLDIDAAGLAAPEVPPDEVEAVWARQVLNLTLERMRAECRTADRMSVWRVFEYRVLRPTLMGTAPPSYEQFARQFGFAGPEQASNALMTAKRQFGRVLKSVVAEYRAAEEVEQELADLRECLTRLGPLGVTIPADLAGEHPAFEPSDELASVQDSDLDIIGQMLEIHDRRDELWNSSDLAELLRDLVGEPLTGILPDVRKLVESDGERSPAALVPATLGELCEQPEPSLALLEGVKNKARQSIRDEASSLPGDVWSVVYFASIAAALVHGGVRISKSNNETLSYGFQRILELDWLTDSLRGLFMAAGPCVATKDPE